jgi:CubicO group peptidase (beta-lactamase class C family)
MRRALQAGCGALLLAAAAIGHARAPGEAATVRRLDGSRIASTEIDARVSRLMHAAQVPGAGIALINSGTVAYQRAYGWRDVEKKLPLTEDTVMTAASLSKSAFAVVVMQLVEAGTLNLDAPISRYLGMPLPEYPGYSDLVGDARCEKLTARMLLSHTSGFPNWRRFEPDGKLHIHFEPGSRFAYSGEGILLLQHAVEMAAHRPIEELMEEREFKPRGMTRTSMTWEPRFEQDYANAYDEEGHSLGPQRRTEADAAGGMQTTLRDYARLLCAILQGRATTAAGRKEMLSPQIRIHSKREFPSLTEETTKENDAIRLSYGLGWGLYWTPYGEAFFKEGHDEGFRHYAVCFTDSKSCLLIMTNSSNGEAVYAELIEQILGNKYTPLEWEGFTLTPPRE